MKLVDYSDSDSETSDIDVEDPPHSPPPAPKPHHAALPPKPARKQIIVDLPKPQKIDDEPSVRKRGRVDAGGGGLFSVLPPPKRTKVSAVASVSGENGSPSAAGMNGDRKDGDASEMKDASVASGIATDETAGASAGVPAPAPFVPRSTQSKKGKGATKPIAHPKPTAPPSIDLFPMTPDTTPKPTITPANPSTYEPLIAQPIPPQPDPSPYESDSEPASQSFIPDTASGPTQISTSDLDSFAAHILEGRHRKNRTINITDYNAAEFYMQNAADKASGLLQEQVAPVRAIGSGRHQLSQLLNNVQDQRESLEEAFAKGRRVKKESGAKYGW